MDSTISFAFGIKEQEVYEKFKKIGDLGEIAEHFAGKKRQSTLFSSRLTVKKVFENLRKLAAVEGKGAVNQKIDLVSELLAGASAREAKYIFRTLLVDMRVGIANGVLREAIAAAFFPDEKNEMAEKIEATYDLTNDFAVVLEAASKGKETLKKIQIGVGKPVNVMLAVKADDIDEAFRICGKPAAIELKYDGFRMVISKNGKDIKLFTRRLEDVTKQFPDIVKAVKESVKGEDFILDAEVVGYDKKTKLYRPFEAISQRIKRKYDIEKLEKELPVEVHVFDVLFYNGKNQMQEPFKQRRALLEKIVQGKKWVLRLAKQIITGDKEKAMKFFEEALKLGEEGIMIKNLNAFYQQGRRVGYMVKMKPTRNDFDLAIVGAEYGSGKRAGWLTSYILACNSDEGLVEVGKVSSGLKEKDTEGTSYEEMTKLLKPLIKSEKEKEVAVEPKIVVSVNYQNIQKSPSYSSGYALRFPRITRYRPDRSIRDIASLEEIEREARKMERKK